MPDDLIRRCLCRSTHVHYWGSGYVLHGVAAYVVYGLIALVVIVAIVAAINGNGGPSNGGYLDDCD